MGMDVTVADMMQAREGRAYAQRTLLERFPGAVLVCLTMNIAGPLKTDAEIERAFSWGKEAVRAVLAPYEQVFFAEIHEKTGPEAIFALRGDGFEIKRRLCALEDGQALGRLLDIDVIKPDAMKISRTELGLPARRCLLCGEAAPVCARSRRHSAAELFARAKAIIREHFDAEFAARTGRMAQRALLYEVALTPKPGLVDRQNAGAHRDMDVFTFIDSSCALGAYFEACARTGLAHRGRAEDCLEALRVPGLLAEQAMKGATGGVNTHKGAIFSLGIYAAALGLTFDGEKPDASAAFDMCRTMTREALSRELSALETRGGKTFGEQIYKKSGVGGIRREAAEGFPSVTQAALPRLRAALDAGLSLNDAGLCALTALMARVEDTNAAKRGGEDAAQQIRRAAGALDSRVQEALSAGQDVHGGITAALEAWDEGFTAAGISPGGCADLTALTLFAHFMEGTGLQHPDA